MRGKSKKFGLLYLFLTVICGFLLLFFTKINETAHTYSVENVPIFSSDPYVVINDNIPLFSESDYAADSYEFYSELDMLGRCGYVIACIGSDIMPTEERGEIGQIKPSGWQTVKYDNVDGKYLFNRCHLIGYQLTGENANKKNLITGTRYMNTQGMLPFENMVADYIKETDNHVLYRVTPIYEGYDLVARGVQMEALSVEDGGRGICFNIYAYNNQPGIVIDYSNGNSWEEKSTNTDLTGENAYILNTNSKRFHSLECEQAKSIKLENRKASYESRDSLIDMGYIPCGACKP